jgi:hypothetical protein
MIFQGQEFGLQTGWNDDNGNGDYEEKLEYRPINWAYLGTESAQLHLDHYSNLIHLRKKNPALYKGTFYDLWRFDPERVIVYGYKDESAGNNNDQVVVIANFSNFSRTVYNVPFLSAGTWYNFMGDNSTLVTNDGNYGVYTIPANTAHVYTNNIYSLSIEPEEKNIISQKLRISTVYPNPFNPMINLHFQLYDNEAMEISVYDIQGKKVRSLYSGWMDRGTHSITWDGKEDAGKMVPSGLYFISFKTGSHIETRKISLVR